MCCRDGCSSGRFSHLQKGTLELCQRKHRVLGHLPDQGPSPPIAQFEQVASSRNGLGGSKLFGTLPQICASTQSCLGALRTIPSTPWLGFSSDMHCQLWDLMHLSSISSLVAKGLNTYCALRKYSAPLNFATFCHISGFKQRYKTVFFCEESTTSGTQS